MSSITGHPLQAAQPIIMDDGTMAYHFRNWGYQVHQAVGDASLVSVWGSISGTLAAQTDLQGILDDATDTSYIVTGVFDDARISESSVTQHEGALTITASQISDLGNPVHTDVANEFAGLTEKLVPADADLLIIEDSAASGVKKKVQIANIAGGGGGGATSTVTVKHVIQTTTNAVAGEFDFDSIPAGYDRLVIEGFIRSDAAAGTFDTTYLFFNADTTASNYHHNQIQGYNNAASASEGATPSLGASASAGSTTDSYSVVRIVIENYAGDKIKTAVTHQGSIFASGQVANTGSTIVNPSMTAAITRVRLRTDNHATDQLLGTMTLYGERQTTLGGGTPTPVDNAATPYTLALADAYTCQRFTAASPAVTIPVEASVNYPVGTEISIRQAGTGTLTLTTTSLTINGTVPSWAQHVEVKFRKVATDTWDVI